MKRAITALTVTGVLLVSGCGSAPGGTTPGGDGPGGDRPVRGPAATGSVPAPPADGTFNATDVMFLQMMLEQHEPAAELLRLAADRAARPEVRTLAAAVEVTQRAEAETMKGWLTGWNQPLTVDPQAHQAHDAHGGHDVLHGTTGADLDLLAQTGATEFDRTFLNILIAHQHNAVELARMVSAGGVHPEVRELAHRIDQSRTGQIRQMLTMVA